MSAKDPERFKDTSNWLPKSWYEEREFWDWVLSHWYVYLMVLFAGIGLGVLI